MAKGRMAERMGFEPTKPIAEFNGLANPRAATANPFDRPQKSGVSSIGAARIGRFTRAMLGLAQAHESAHNKVKSIEQLLSRYTVAENGCHEWTGATNGKGYGVMLLGGGAANKKLLLLAHRLQWMHHNGKLEPRQVVMHRCDNRLCINIDHLQSGTQLGNMHDMIRKGRANYSGLRHSGPSAQESAQKRIGK